MFKKSFPTVKTENLILRKVKPEDIVFYSALSKPETSLYEFWEPHKTLQDTQNFLEEIFARYSMGQFYDWTIERITDGEQVGMINFHDVYPLHSRADLGFWIVKRFRNNGYATEAAKGLIEYGCNTLGFERIQSHCAVENEASVRVLEKIGMKREAMLEKYVRLNVDKTKLSDVYLYTIFSEVKNGI